MTLMIREDSRKRRRRMIPREGLTLTLEEYGESSGQKEKIWQRDEQRDEWDLSRIWQKYKWVTRGRKSVPTMILMADDTTISVHDVLSFKFLPVTAHCCYAVMFHNNGTILPISWIEPITLQGNYWFCFGYMYCSLLRVRLCWDLETNFQRILASLSNMSPLK